MPIIPPLLTRPMLTPAQIEFYRDQGYLGIENVFSTAEVAALRRATDEFV